VDWELASYIAGIFAATIALMTLIGALLEYRRQGAQGRVERFIEIRRRLKEDQVFKKIAELVEFDSPNLREVPFQEKRDYLGLLEEVALQMNSGLIRKEVAHYMFGYYAIRCWKSKYFWKGVNKESHYWSLFRYFVSEMQKVEKSYTFKQRNLKF
jgi:hypothetical protein